MEPMSQGQFLLRARQRMGFRQEDAAQAIGVTRAMISYWESGRRIPNDRQLVALGDLYRTGMTALLTGEGLEDARDETEMLFRGADLDLPAGARPGVTEFRHFLDNYARLADVVGIGIHGLRQSPFISVKGAPSMAEARRKAEEVRAHLRIGLGPITDLDAMCELLGVTVYQAALGSDLTTTISGGFVDHPVVGFSILVNVEMTPGRRRFTVAHELAHALFHSGPKTKFVLSGTTKDVRERFADWFAGEFLMPTEGIRRVMEEHGRGTRVTDPVDVVHLQRYFNVSYATALVRLLQARIVSEEDFQKFKEVRSIALAEALGYEIDDEEHRQSADDWRLHRFPGRFLRMLRSAVESGAISVPTAAQLTDLSIDEIEELAGDQTFVGETDLREFDEFAATGVA